MALNNKSKSRSTAEMPHCSITKSWQQMDSFDLRTFYLLPVFCSFFLFVLSFACQCNTFLFIIWIIIKQYHFYLIQMALLHFTFLFYSVNLHPLRFLLKTAWSIYKCEVISTGGLNYHKTLKKLFLIINLSN